MDSYPPLSSMGSREATRMSTRSRPLHTCGISIVAIARKASKRMKDYKEPIGSMMNKTVKLAASTSLFVYIMQFQWLALLSFIDDHILAIEQHVENIFPPSTYVFDKIDELVRIAESLPGKFDNAANKFPVIIHQVPILERALLHVISWLNFLIAALTSCASDRTREKDIMIDIKCNDRTNESQSIGKAEQIMESPTHSSNEKLDNFHPTSDTPKKADTNMNEAGVTKCSYKEILEKGTKENIENKEDSTSEEIQKANVGKEETQEGRADDENKTIKDVVKNDPILELFESAWHMKS